MWYGIQLLQPLLIMFSLFLEDQTEALLSKALKFPKRNEDISKALKLPLSTVFSLNLIQLYPKISHSGFQNIYLFTSIMLIAKTQAHLRNQANLSKHAHRTNLKVLPLFIYYLQLFLEFPFVIPKAFTQYLLLAA